MFSARRTATPLESTRRLMPDVYFAIGRYPLPPVDVRIEGGKLHWHAPRYAAEIAGDHIYHSTTSGANYRRLPMHRLDHRSR